jgi:hypothetical protein
MIRICGEGSGVNAAMVNCKGRWRKAGVEARMSE